MMFTDGRKKQTKFLFMAVKKRGYRRDQGRMEGQTGSSQNLVRVVMPH